jgi:cytoskeletal protein RodZ
MAMQTSTIASPVAGLANLAAIRERKGLTLRQISESTKISTSYLRAIEQAEFDRLPGGVFSRSYIRQYAHAIDYDEWDLLARYRAVVGPDEAVSEEPRERRFLGLLRLPAPLMRLLAPARRT